MHTAIFLRGVDTDVRIQIQRYPLTWVVCRRCRAALRMIFTSIHVFVLYVSLNHALFAFTAPVWHTRMFELRTHTFERQPSHGTHNIFRVHATRVCLHPRTNISIAKFKHSFITTGRKSIFILDIGSVWKPTIFQFDAAWVESRLLLFRLLLPWAASYFRFHCHAVGTST